jgi:glycosyl hydrolase family 26
MKKIKRILSAVSAAVLCAMPMVNGVTVNAASSSQMKTYVVYNVATRSDIAYFDFALNYESDVTAEESMSTSLLSKGYFSSINKKSSYKLQNTYNGPAIGSTGKVASTKFIVPMNTESIYDKVTYSDAVIRNANGVTLSSTSIIMDEVLLGDVNLDGVVNKDDSDLILGYLTDRDQYHITEKGFEAADVYNRGDGVSGSDAYTIQQYIAGQISHF